MRFKSQTSVRPHIRRPPSNHRCSLVTPHHRLTPPPPHAQVLRGLRPFGASLHKLMVDDKGATLIATVGLPEQTDTDPLRAVRAALQVEENL